MPFLQKGCCGKVLFLSPLLSKASSVECPEEGTNWHEINFHRRIVGTVLTKCTRYSTFSSLNPFRVHQLLYYLCNKRPVGTIDWAPRRGSHSMPTSVCRT